MIIKSTENILTSILKMTNLLSTLYFNDVIVQTDTSVCSDDVSDGFLVLSPGGRTTVGSDRG